MRFASLFLIASLGAVTAAACYVGPLPKDEAKPTTDQNPTDPESAMDPQTEEKGTPAETTGLPCEIDALLETRCRSCHGAGTQKAPMALVTYDDLVAMAESDDTQTYAELSLERMKSTDDPMPPKGTKATAAELKAFTKWIADDYPRGTCGESTYNTGTDAGKKTDAGTKPPVAAKPDAGAATPDAGPTSSAVCSSGVTWASPEKSTKMNPGRACITCHSKIAGEPILQVAGTIYPTSNEPDKCYGVQGVSVVITDATGRKVTVTTGSTGNFTLSTAATAIVYPLKVKVVKNGIERAMVGTAPHGDCNACHTATGNNGAPGRILTP